MAGKISSLSSASLFRNLITSSAPSLLWLRRTVLVLLCVVGMLRLNLIMQSFYPPYVYSKDFIQEYLSARAVLAGINPYLPLPELASKFIGPVPVPVLPHSTPHPPPAVFLGLPFGLLPYTWATALWGGGCLYFV